MFTARVAAGLPLVLVGCSLVIGELPAPLPNDAGAGQGQASGGASGGNGVTHRDPPDAAEVGDSGVGGVSEPDAVDGASQSAAADAGFDPCDRDGDGEANAGCGGEDCDDDDRRAHHGQEEFFDQESETVAFDYNCSGDIEREYPVALTCSIDACNPTTQGFLAPPPQCGVEGAWGRCISKQVAGLPTTCERQTDEMRRVACH